MNVIEDFYQLCDIMDDDMELVAIAIHLHYRKKIKLSAIKDDLEFDNYSEARLVKYWDAINEVLDKPMQHVIAFKERHLLNRRKQGILF